MKKKLVQIIDTCHLCSHIRYDDEGEAWCWFWEKCSVPEEDFYPIYLGNEFEKLEIDKTCPLDNVEDKEDD